MEVPSFRSRFPSGSGDPLDPLALLAAWWQAAGPPVARVASPRGVVRRRLQVAVPDPHWKRELGALREEILARLRRMEGLEELEGIDLLLEEGLPGEGPSTRGEELPDAPGGAGAEIESSARSIADSALARRWTAAVARLLSRRGKGQAR